MLVWILTLIALITWAGLVVSVLHTAEIKIRRHHNYDDHV